MRVGFPRRSSRPFFVAAAALAGAAGVLGAVAAVTGGVVASAVGASACTNTTAVDYSLFAGITVSTQYLLGNDDYQCGVGSNEVYKYIAIVINENRDIGGAGLFDCFANGSFANLPGTDGGRLNFALWIYAYTKADFDTQNAKNGGNYLVNAVAALNGVNQADGSVVPVSSTSVPDGGTATGLYASALSAICLSPATWTSTCSASSGAGVQVLANCSTLALEKPGASACNLADLIPDSGVDAGPDAH